MPTLGDKYPKGVGAFFYPCLLLVPAEKLRLAAREIIDLLVGSSALIYLPWIIYTIYGIFIKLTILGIIFFFLKRE
jgi:hypothetical protein